MRKKKPSRKPSKRPDNRGEQRREDRLLRATTDELLDALGVADWDVLIVGDGSGTAWNEPCGWAAVLHERSSGLRQSFVGGMSRGVNNACELMPYLHAMLWYAYGPGGRRLSHMAARGNVRPIRVHVVTDAEVLAARGNGRLDKRENAELWAAFDTVAGRGYEVSWHWVARDRVGLNRLVDYLSRMSRFAVRGSARLAAARLKGIRPPEGTSIYDFNP